MNNQTILIAIITLLIGGIGGYLISNNKNSCSHTAPMGMHQMPDGSLMGDTDSTMGGMKQMDHMDHMTAMMVTSERAFIEGMIPHHQEAVDTAKEVILRGGTTPAIKKLVEDIVVAQDKEIADMKSWYQAWYGVPYQDTGTYMPMMRDLEKLSGVALDQAFLEDMITHHMGAIMMAKSVVPYIEHDEVTALTEAIVATQTAEIAEMQELIQGLK